MSTGRIIGGILLISLGILWLLDMLGVIHFNICIIGPIIMIAAGIALLVSKNMWLDWW